MTAHELTTARTTAELFQALALCGLIEDPERRQCLMSGVLQQMTSGRSGEAAALDPAWPDLAALVVSPRIRTRRASTPAVAPPGLWLTVPATREHWPVGAVMQWTWLLQGWEQVVIGQVEQHDPVLVRVHRSFYEQMGHPVAPFVRAYDGLRRLGFTVREAQDVLGEINPVDLLEIVARAYRKRGALQSPKTYVLACIRSARAA